jgi:addiction module HigA family antidote
MENASAKISLRDDFQRKDGSYPVYLRVTIHRRTKKYSLAISVMEKHWDSEKLRVKRGDLKHQNKNLIIESNILRADTIINDFKAQRKHISFDVFEEQYLLKKEKINTDSFIDFFINEVETDYKHKGSYDTYRSRKTIINKLRAFGDGDVLFDEIDYDFVKRFNNHLKLLGNNESTRAKNLRSLKAMVNRAVLQKKVKENPVTSFKYKEKPGEREYLTKDEVKQLEILMDKPETHFTIKKSLVPFLFCCYTGLRFRDVSNLRFKNIDSIDENGKATKTIKFIMHKTKDPHEVPLNSKALALIPPKTFDEAKIFRVYTNQPMNRFLKDAMKAAEINKKISFHCSRHTFATLLLNAKVPIEVVSNLLGHKDIKTTQIYAKVLPKSKVKAIENLDNELRASEDSMGNTTHPGSLLKEELKARGIIQDVFAEKIDVSPEIFNDLIVGKRGLTPELSIKIGNGLEMEAEKLMVMQSKYDIDCIRFAQKSNPY